MGASPSSSVRELSTARRAFWLCWQQLEAAGGAEGVMAEDFFEEGELPPEEPVTWRPPVPCPQCQQTRTRFLTLRHEMSVYACERCRIQFEVEEAA